jgi:hypothetical protein
LKLIFCAPNRAAVVGDDYDFDTEAIIDIRQSHVGAGGGLIELGGILHAQGFMQVLIVEDVDKVIELGLLLQEV